MSPDVLALLQSGGAVGVLVALVVLLLRGDLVPRWAHEDALNERDHWRDLALRGTELAKDAVGTLGRK